MVLDFTGLGGGAVKAKKRSFEKYVQLFSRIKLPEHNRIKGRPMRVLPFMIYKFYIIRYNLSEDAIAKDATRNRFRFLRKY